MKRFGWQVVDWQAVPCPGQERAPSLLGRCKQKQGGLRGLLCRWPSITEWEIYITAQGPPVSEMTYTVSSGTLNSTIPYHFQQAALTYSHQVRTLWVMGQCQNVIPVLGFSEVAVVTNWYAEILQAGCPSCSPTNSVIVQKVVFQWLVRTGVPYYYGSMHYLCRSSCVQCNSSCLRYSSSAAVESRLEVFRYWLTRVVLENGR